MQSSEVLHAVREYRYNPMVFILSPWLEIYNHDSERKQDFEEAVKTWQAVKEAHIACGYSLVEISKSSIKIRAHFIARSIKNYPDIFFYNN
jgi:predicted ATPase